MTDQTGARPAGDGRVHTLAFVGAGAMGAPAVERLLAAGARIRLVVRDADRAARWAAAGANVHATPARAAAGVDALVVFVRTEEQVIDVLEGTDGALRTLEKGALLIVHSTISRGASARIDRLARRQGIRYVDAPVDGADTDVQQGTLRVLLAGGSADVDRAAPIVQHYATTVVRTGPTGSATALKLTHNLLLAADLQLAAAAVGLAQDLGVEPAIAIAGLTQLTASSGALMLLGLFGGNTDELAAAAGPHLRKDAELAARSIPPDGSGALLLQVLETGSVPLAPASLDAPREHRAEERGGPK